MVRRYKKILASLLLGVVSLQMVLPLFLSFFILFITLLQRQIIEEITVNTAPFQQMVISEHDTQFAFLSRQEFRYKGVLYDIRSITIEKGSYVIEALSDKQETRLCDISIRQNEQDSKQVSAQIKSVPFFFLFFESMTGTQLFLKYSDDYFITPYNYNLSKAYTKIVKPPPRFPLA